MRSRRWGLLHQACRHHNICQNFTQTEAEQEEEEERLRAQREAQYRETAATIDGRPSVFQARAREGFWK